jgi:hypothetical protein
MATETQPDKGAVCGTGTHYSKNKAISNLHSGCWNTNIINTKDLPDVVVKWLLLLFMSTGGDNVSELWPSTGLLFILQKIYEYGQPLWNDTDGGSWRTQRKTCPSATLSTKNPTWTDSGMNPDLCGEGIETNHPSQGTTTGQVVSTPALYWGGPRFKSQPGDQLSWLVFMVFLSPSRQILG